MIMSPLTHACMLPTLEGSMSSGRNSCAIEMKINSTHTKQLWEQVGKHIINRWPANRWKTTSSNERSTRSTVKVRGVKFYKRGVTINKRQGKAIHTEMNWRVNSTSTASQVPVITVDRKWSDCAHSRSFKWVREQKVRQEKEEESVRKRAKREQNKWKKDRVKGEKWRWERRWRCTKREKEGSASKNRLVLFEKGKRKEENSLLCE